MPHAVVIPISTFNHTSLTRSSYEQSASSHIGSCAQSPRAHTNKPAAAREQRTRHGGARAACAAQLRGKHNTHTARTHRAQFTGRAALARRLRAGINTTGHARGTHYQIHPTFHFKNTQVMEATLKKQRHQGALVITGPLVSPALTYLSALSGCRVTRTEGGKFAPQRTTQEKNAFIKSMLQQYANVESFQWWCSVLHEFVKEEPLLRLKLHLSVYLDCDLREIPKKKPCAELIRDYGCKLFLLKLSVLYG